MMGHRDLRREADQRIIDKLNETIKALVEALALLRNEASELMTALEAELDQGYVTSSVDCLRGPVEVADAALALARGETS